MKINAYIFYQFLSLFFLLTTSVSCEQTDESADLLEVNEQEVISKTSTDCTTKTLATGVHRLPVWTSDAFNGSFCRKYQGDLDFLKITLNQTAGGFDAAVAITNPQTLVDNIKSNLTVSSTVNIHLEGEGNWWVGPKFSVKENISQGLEGNYENYVIENASRTPEEYHERFSSQGIYLGKTRQDGSTYRHYVTTHKTWEQYWAIRQNYRERGSVSINPILELWRNNGLPNEYLRTIRVNVETSKEIKGTITMKTLTIPTSLSEN
ncbi:glycoside hydrolase family 11 protein [uncultured Aquimarina sp.]|uniref:glycoside hydrolase family 11 protein n=1 Tax=uncultured Aquimarina sp. TaxID=575652 RepID=UPI00260EF231|nr:glycoside hydrolase family 11 protein [uncultured Aquimarina sp.]